MKITKAFEGYIWLSDSQTPILYMNDKEEIIDIENVNNPFIVEGYLFDGTTSYSIKMIDGEYKKQEIVISKLQKAFKDQSYIANRMGEKQLVFRQYWQEEEDPYCEDMKTLRPAEFAFIGFKKNKKKED